MLDNEGATAASFAYYPRLKKVKDFVDQHLDNKISLATAAQIAGLEEKYFSTYFRKKTGMCFNHWVSYVRIERATSLMGVHDYSITRIAFTVGFQELRSFERVFKKYTGTTPREYKRTVQQNLSYAV